MNWRGAGQLVAMGGYGLYVWGSVGMVLVGLVSEWVVLTWRLRSAQRQVRSFHAGDESSLGAVE
jgi:heme exporter protein D